jgi:hypothetical protein
LSSSARSRPRRPDFGGGWSQRPRRHRLNRGGCRRCPARCRRPTVATTAGPAFLTGAPGTRTRVSTRAGAPSQSTPPKRQPRPESIPAGCRGRPGRPGSGAPRATILAVGGRKPCLYPLRPNRTAGLPASPLGQGSSGPGRLVLPESWLVVPWLRRRRREGRGGTVAGCSRCAELADMARPMAVVAWRTGRTPLGAVRGCSQ